MLLSSIITLSAFTTSIYVMLASFGIAYGSLAFAAASIWSLPGDVAPTPDYVASIDRYPERVPNLAGIVITTFTGLMLALTKGSFTIPLVVAGGFCFLVAFSYLVIVGKIEPLRIPGADAARAAATSQGVGGRWRVCVFLGIDAISRSPWQ